MWSLSLAPSRATSFPAVGPLARGASCFAGDSACCPTDVSAGSGAGIAIRINSPGGSIVFRGCTFGGNLVEFTGNRDSDFAMQARQHTLRTITRVCVSLYTVQFTSFPLVDAVGAGGVDGDVGDAVPVGFGGAAFIGIVSNTSISLSNCSFVSNRAFGAYAICILVHPAGDGLLKCVAAAFVGACRLWGCTCHRSRQQRRQRQ